MQQLHSAYQHEVCRKWMVNLPTKDQIIYPIFVLDVENDTQEIKSMPGIARYGYKNINDHLKPLVDKGLQSILIFGVLSDDNKKDEQGTYAGTLDENLEGPVHKAIKSIKAAFPKLLIIADVCLCAYTSHGHCGIIKNMKLENDESIKRLAEVTVSYARAGAHIVAPSDMMENRVSEMKKYLIKYGFPKIPIMSYSAKFASSYYGPFRDVCKSTPVAFDRQSYQLPLDSTELAIKAVERDLKEGCDFVILKPLGQYLDIAAKVKQQFPTAILVGYQVSGEFSQVAFAAQAGACELQKMVLEQLRCIKRAGVEVVITYWAPQILDWLEK